MSNWKCLKSTLTLQKIVDLFVEYSIHINAQNQDGLTPLHVARGEEEIVNFNSHQIRTKYIHITAI